MVWRFDRFARSTQALINACVEFKKLGVDFISIQEQIDTTTPQGEMVFTIFAAISQFESSLISERVKAGMRRAKNEGKKIGRPAIKKINQEQIKKLHKKGFSAYRISKQTMIPYSTVKSYVKKI